MSRHQGTTIEEIQRESKKLRARNSSSSKRALKVASRYIKSKIRQAQKSRKSGATRGAGKFSKVGKAVSLLMKKHAGGAAGDAYSAKSKDAEFISSHCLGQTPKERREEWELEVKKHPGVDPKKIVVHISLSRPAGHELTKEEWKKVIDGFLENLGAKGVMYVAQRHRNTAHDHAHLTFSRALPSGKLLSESHDFWRFREAAQAAAKQCGIEIDGTAEARPQRPSDAAVSAKRKAERLGTSTKVWLEPSVVKEVLTTAKTFEDFAKRLGQKGIEVKQLTRPDGQVTGVLYQNAGSGSDQWLAGSTISRELTLPKIQAQIEKNAAAAAKAMPKPAPVALPMLRPVPAKPQPPQPPQPPQLPRQRG